MFLLFPHQSLLLFHKSILLPKYAAPNIFSLTLEIHLTTFLKIFLLIAALSYSMLFPLDITTAYAHDPNLHFLSKLLFHLLHLPIAISLIFSAIFPINILYQYFVIHTKWYSISYTVWLLLLYSTMISTPPAYNIS